MVLHETFHLSYPFTFFIGDTACVLWPLHTQQKCNNHGRYMVPEGNEGGRVTLYKSVPASYPVSW